MTTPTAPRQLVPNRQITLGHRAGLDAQVMGVAADAHRVYATLYYADPNDPHSSPGPGELIVLDRHSLDVGTAHRIAVGWQPRRVAVDAQHQRVYVVNYGQQSYSVMVFDSRTLQPVGAPIVIGAAVVDIAVDAARGRAYAPSIQQRRVHVIDGIAGVALAPIRIATDFTHTGPYEIGFDEASGLLTFTQNLQSGPGAPIDRIVTFDPAVPTLRDVTALPAASRPADVALDPNTGRAYVGVRGVTGGPDPGVTVVSGTSPFDGAPGQPDQHIFFPNGAETVAVDRFRRKVYATGGFGLRMIDTATDLIEAEHTFGQQVFGVAVGPADSAVYVGGVESETGRLWEFLPERPRQAPGAPLGAPIAVAATGELDMVTFVVGEDGQAYLSRWADDGTDWSPWVPLGGRFPLRAPLTACSLGGGRWRVAGVDERGVLVTRSGQAGVPDAGWTDTHGAAHEFPAGAHVSMISRYPGHWNAFSVDARGQVVGAGGDSTTSVPRLQIVPGPGFEPGAEIVANSRMRQHWDLFVLHQGQVWTTWWTADAPGWHEWAPIGFEEFPGGFGPDAKVAVCGRNEDQLDVMVVAPDGSVQATYWKTDFGHWSSWESKGGNFPPGTRLSLVGRQEDRLDVFGIGASGLHTAWYSVDEGWSAWTHLGPAPWVPGGTPVAAVARFPWGLDVFWAGVDGHVHTAWWTHTSTWSIAVGIDRTIPTPMHRFDRPITTTTELSGRLTADIWQDGSYYVRGHMHGSGWDPFDYAVQGMIRSQNGDVGAISYRAGHVDGTGSEPWPWGDPDRDDWWADIGVNDAIRADWAGFAGGTLEVERQYKNDGLGGYWDQVGSLVLGLAVRAFLTGGRSIVFALLAHGLRALLNQVHTGTGDHAGIIIRYGSVFLMSPNGLVPVVVEDVATDAITEAVLGVRELSEDEKKFARTVFGPSLDDIFYRVRITRLEHLRGSAIVVPLLGLDDTAEDIITVNMGGLHDKLLEGENRLEFIHELVHVWQIRHNTFTPHWALWVLGEHFEGDAAYEYERDGRRWSGYEFEEQAELVEDWFGAHVDEPGGLTSAAALQDDRFRYIRDNIRLSRI